MKKNSFSYSRMVAAILIITVITGSIVWLTPAFAKSKNSKNEKAVAAASTPAQKNVQGAEVQEGTQLVKRLIADHLVDELKGFTVEKKQKELYIDHKLQAAAISDKYLSTLKQESIYITVHPFMQRLIEHSQSGILQVISPIEFSSPCVQTTTKKPGC